MTKLYSLFSNEVIDTAQKVVELNQVVVNQDGVQSVVINIYNFSNRDGYQYEILDIRTLKSFRTQIIRPLSNKFGIGTYYDDKNPTFLSNEEVADLIKKMNVRIKLETEEAEIKRVEREATEAKGKEWLNNNLPHDAKAIIVACFIGCDYNPNADYQDYSASQYKILGFSTSVKTYFAELRKYAGNFKKTEFLQEEAEHLERRERKGSYLGNVIGWVIKKVVIQNREEFIHTWSYRAGNPDNIFIKDSQLSLIPTQVKIDLENLKFEIVQYSEKCIALFGDTKPIKDKLGDRNGLNGKFNPRLTHNGIKTAGWIFLKSKEEDLKTFLGEI